MSVPVWGTTLSGPLPVVGLVSRLPHQLPDGPQRSSLEPRKFLAKASKPFAMSCGISSPFELLSPV